MAVYVDWVTRGACLPCVRKFCICDCMYCVTCSGILFVGMLEGVLGLWVVGKCGCVINLFCCGVMLWSWGVLCCCERGGMRDFGICVGVFSDVLSLTIWWVACICISGVNAASLLCCWC